MCGASLDFGVDKYLIDFTLWLITVLTGFQNDQNCYACTVFNGTTLRPGGCFRF